MTYILIESYLVKVHRIRPRTIIPDIRRLDIESLRPNSIILLRAISLEASRRNVKHALMVADSGSPHTATRLGSVDLKLTRSVQCMADELPLDQVATVIDGSAGKIFKGGGDQEKVLVNSND